MNRILRGLTVAVAVCSLVWVSGMGTRALAAGNGQQGAARDAGAGGNGTGGGTGTGTVTGGGTGTGTFTGGGTGTGTGAGTGVSDTTTGPTEVRDAGTAPDAFDGGTPDIPEIGFRSSSRSTVVE